MGLSVLKLVLECGSDLFYVPCLFVIAKRKRHFEFFIGAFMCFCSFFYNLANALEVDVFLSELAWHELTNVLSISFSGFLMVFLMQNDKEWMDHLLRYGFFSIVWMCQLRDDFWMEKSAFTLWASCGLLFLLVVRVAHLRGRYFELLKLKELGIGMGSFVVAGIFFHFSQDDEHDVLKIEHSLAQLFFGVALFFLWSVAKKSSYKKNDDLPLL